MSQSAAIVLAAGQGTRMKSALPKVLHPLCGVPLAEWVVRALRAAGVSQTVVVVGHGAAQVREALGAGLAFALQEEQLGTGHAAMMARPVLKDFDGPVLVLAGDVPLISAETLRELLEAQRSTGAACVMSTFVVDDPTGYGRILRDGDGEIAGIVEHKDCNDAQLLISEVNPAVYCFDSQKLWSALPRLKNENSQGEYYLPDVVGLFVSDGERVLGVRGADSDEFRGINDRWQLAEMSDLVRERILRRHAMNGVSVVDPRSTVVGPDVEIGQDTTLYPNTVLEGRTVVGSNSHIGPNSWLKDSRVGDFCRVFMSHLDQADMGEGSRCGPFANLRPGTVLEREVKVGNFVEVKNSLVRAGVSASHLTYIGDAEVGARTNIGAGVITCNYDGHEKHRTVIGADCFVGSNSTLVAPLAIGEGSMVAAGSVVTSDVPDGALAIGRGRQENKEGWFKAWRQKKGRT